MTKISYARKALAGKLINQASGCQIAAANPRRKPSTVVTGTNSRINTLDKIPIGEK